MNASNIYKCFLLLLITSWLVILFFVLYPFFMHGIFPSFWLLLILLIMPFLMFVQKLKIGNFFDFLRSDSNSGEKAMTIGQQINVSLIGQESANAFASSISAALQNKSLQEITHGQSSEFIRTIDHILLTSIQIIRIYYDLIISLTEGPRKIPDDNIHNSWVIESDIIMGKEKIDFSSVLILVDYIQTNIKAVFSNPSQLLIRFRNIQRLFELRSSIDSHGFGRSANKSALKIIIKAQKSILYLTGFITGNWFALRSFINILKKSDS